MEALQNEMRGALDAIRDRVEEIQAHATSAAAFETEVASLSGMVQRSTEVVDKTGKALLGAVSGFQETIEAARKITTDTAQTLATEAEKAVQAAEASQTAVRALERSAAELRDTYHAGTAEVKAALEVKMDEATRAFSAELERVHASTAEVKAAFEVKMDEAMRTFSTELERVQAGTAEVKAMLGVKIDAATRTLSTELERVQAGTAEVKAMLGVKIDAATRAFMAEQRSVQETLQKSLTEQRIATNAVRTWAIAAAILGLLAAIGSATSLLL